MKVIYCKIGQAPKILEIDGTLESMQSLVGGYIETYPYEYEPMVFVMNEEGKLRGLQPHRIIASGRDIICGDFFVTAFGKNGDGEDDIVGLTEEQESIVLATIGLGRFC